jgi:hypothetical protein
MRFSSGYPRNLQGNCFSRRAPDYQTNLLSKHCIKKYKIQNTKYKIIHFCFCSTYLGIGGSPSFCCSESATTRNDLRPIDIRSGAFTTCEEFTNVKQLFMPYYQRTCQQVTYEGNSLPADFLAIASKRLVNVKYRGSQIPPHAYPAQRGIRAGFCCLTS